MRFFLTLPAAFTALAASVALLLLASSASAVNIHCVVVGGARAAELDLLWRTVERDRRGNQYGLAEPERPHRQGW